MSRRAIAVCGGGLPGADDEPAERLGREIARRRLVLICGGRTGAMEAACRGAREEGGTTVGVLPGADPAEANPYVDIPIATGMGQARNLVIVQSAGAVIAIGGEWGTLSEIALARKVGRPVVLLRPTLAASLDLPVARDPQDAVEQAVRLAGWGA